MEFMWGITGETESVVVLAEISSTGAGRRSLGSDTVRRPGATDEADV